MRTARWVHVLGRSSESGRRMKVKAGSTPWVVLESIAPSLPAPTVHRYGVLD